ncbi:hypothetical protein DYB32_000159 [Aphanomyces invadans]|uniref:Uncharacterized protein n=1 Tax=Aphanomyces invadans TaxID=157072 RepID=A0A3R6VIL5_9STRA|nr:hypothetical protein DYB32_000159 [Aphanomyces invadans]
MHVMNLHGMKAEPSSPVRPRAAEATDRAALRYSPPRRSSDSANKLQAFHIDGNPALGKRKRLQHTSSIDAMPRISPKTSTSNNEEDRSISVRIIDQPPRVWYRDQKGRRTVFCMTVGIVDQLERFVSADHITGGYFTTTLLYENGSRDLTLLSIGDLSTFATSAKSSTFDDALMLKSLSQVSVADYGAPSSCPTTAATTTLATDSTSHRHYMVDSTMHDALSRFTDSTICASNTEASVVVVGLSPLEGDGVSGGLPAFDGDWRLVGVYHHGPPRGGLLVWDANVNMEDEVRQMKEGTAGRRATDQYLALGDPGIGTLDKLKAAVLRRSIH